VPLAERGEGVSDLNVVNGLAIGPVTLDRGVPAWKIRQVAVTGVALTVNNNIGDCNSERTSIVTDSCPVRVLNTRVSTGRKTRKRRG